MSVVAQRLARIGRTDSPVVMSGAVVAQVLAAGDDDRDVVASADGGNTVQTMRCTSGYPTRTVGDLVLAVLVGARWHVLGKLGAHPAGQVTADDVDDAISAALGRLDIPPTIKVTWGQGAPSGDGWRQGTAVYARDDGDGDRSIYLDVSTGSGGSTKPTPPAKPPAPVTIHPNSMAGWRGSYQDPHPKQGDASPWGRSGQWVSGFFYGSQIWDACHGKTVTKVEVWMARQSGGIYGGVTLRMGLHNRLTLGKPAIHSRWDGPSLPVGGAGWVTLPAAVRDELVAGGRGIGVGGIDTAGYAVFSTSSGDVRITFG